MNEKCEKETHQSSENMKKFSDNLENLKQMIKTEYEKTGDEFVRKVYTEFNRIYKVKD